MLVACSWNVNRACFEAISDVTYEAPVCALRLLVLVLAREYRTLAVSHSACVSRVRGDDPSKDATGRVAEFGIVDREKFGCCDIDWAICHGRVVCSVRSYSMSVLAIYRFSMASMPK
jgi:hypothetical protein